MPGRLDVRGERELGRREVDPAGGPGTSASIAATQSVMSTVSPARLKTLRTVEPAAARLDQGPGDVLGVLERGPAAERDRVRQAQDGGRDGHRSAHWSCPGRGPRRRP